MSRVPQLRQRPLLREDAMRVWLSSQGAAMSDAEIRPRIDKEGVPRCDEDCPFHDGKRCMVTGFRPDSICEPQVAHDRRELARLTDLLAAQQQEIEGLRADAELDDKMRDACDVPCLSG